MDIIQIKPEHHPLVKSLYHCYLHDLSEFESPFRMNEQGAWEPYLLPDWLDNKPGAISLLVRDCGQIIGFAFVGTHPFPKINPERDFRFCEFFIGRAWRQRGMGRLAARKILQMHPGQWEMVVLPGNQAALSFWRTIIADLNADHFRREITDEGAVFSFRIP